MRILFLSSEHAFRRGTGGVGSYVATMSAALAAKGHDVHVLTCERDSPREDTEVAGVRIHARPLLHIKGFRHVWRGEHSRERLMLTISAFRSARELGSFDVIEAPEWRSEALLFVARRGAPVVIHLHTPHRLIRQFEGGRRTIDDRICDFMEAWTAKRAAAITSPSQLVVDRLRDMKWLGEQPVHIIRYPVDTERFRPGEDDSEPRRVLCVGRIEPRKAPELLLDALRILKDEGVQGVAAYAGRGSGSRDGLPFRDWIARHGAELGVDWVELAELGWEEMPGEYAKARVVCVPSHFESFSMAVVEAMAAGRPVVVAPDVGAGEVIVREPSQRIAEHSASAFAAALRPFLTDREAAHRVGTMNRLDVEDACLPQFVADRRLALFTRLCNQRSQGT